jgi:hypothetical protein
MSGYDFRKGQRVIPPIPSMAHLPAQPCTEHRRHGFVRCSDHWLRAALTPSSSFAWTAEIWSGSNVTANPTAEWIARQITEAFPWSETPKYLIRDRDRAYGAVVSRRLRAMGIRNKADCTGLTLAERLCRTTDRIDPARVRGPFHRLILGEAHLCRILRLAPMANHSITSSARVGGTSRPSPLAVLRLITSSCDELAASRARASLISLHAGC